MSKRPEYTWWDQVPPNLKTKTKMRQEDGLVPTGDYCALISYGRGRRAVCYELFDVAQSRPLKKATSAQIAALAKGRAKQDEDRRTCFYCKEVKPYYIEGPCNECLQEQTESRDREAHNDGVMWARALLTRTDWLILDFETTGLGGYAVEVALLHPSGRCLLSSRLNPLHPIERGAQCVHGISDDDVQGKPTFKALEEQLREIIAGNTLVAYNAEFDQSVLSREALRVVGDYSYPRVQTWADKIKWIDAMVPYSDWVGEWSEYWGSYRWQKLGGNHGAEGDCRQCLKLIQAMAKSEFQEVTPPK